MAVTNREGLRRAALDLIRSVLPTQRGIRLVGVTVSSFVEAGAAAPTELPIFAEAAA